MFKVNRKHQSVPLKQVVPVPHVITCLLHLQKGKIIASSIITSSSGYFLQHNLFGKLFSLNLLLAIIFAINVILTLSYNTIIKPVLKFIKSSLKSKSYTSVWVIIFCWHLVHSLGNLLTKLFQHKIFKLVKYSIINYN